MFLPLKMLCPDEHNQPFGILKINLLRFSFIILCGSMPLGKLKEMSNGKRTDKFIAVLCFNKALEAIFTTTLLPVHTHIHTAVL